MKACFMCRRYTKEKCNKLGYKVNHDADCELCPFFHVLSMYDSDVIAEINEEIHNSTIGYSPLEDLVKDLAEIERY